MGKTLEVPQQRKAPPPVPLHQTPAGKAAVWAGRRWWRHRLVLLPLNTAAATFAGAVALHGADPGAVHTVLGILGATEAAALGGHWEWRRRNGRRLNVTQTVYNTACGTFVFGFEAAATLTSPTTPGMLRAFAAATIAATTAWWLRGAATDAVEAESQGQSAATGTTTAGGEEEIGPDRIWAKRIAAPGGALPGSALTGIGPFIDSAGQPNGWTATLDLNPGDKVITLKASDVAAHLEKIHEAFDVPVANIAITPRSGGRMDVKMFERHPLMRRISLPDHTGEPYAWAQPIGLNVLDEPVMHQLFDPDYGTWHGTFIGSTGSGKSETICTVMAAEARIVTEHGDPLVSHVLLDPHKGVSYPGWADKASLFASDYDDILAILKLLIGLKNRRLDDMARYKWKVWRPTPETPLVSVKLDEFVTVATHRKDVIDVVEEAVGEFRKVGMALAVGLRYPGVQNFGGKMDLRDGLMGYTWLGRTGNRSSGMIVSNGRAVGDPALIPTHFTDGKTTGGLGFWLGSTADASVQMRMALTVLDEMAWIRHGRCGITAADVARARAEAEAEKAAKQDPDGSFATTPTATASAATDSGGTLWDRIHLFLTDLGDEATTGQICRALGVPDDKKSSVTMACSRAENSGNLVDAGHGKWVLPQHARLAGVRR